jgi:hypothetical protein
MRTVLPRRAAYRVQQFGRALLATWCGPDQEELEQARRWLPPAGWQLFVQMPRSEQKHALSVWHSLRSAGYQQPELAQAALLHDVSKYRGGVTLVHRVAVVLIKALAPRTWQHLKVLAEPPRTDLRYPLWAHANHPAGSATLAAAAGCSSEAVDLIRRHQEVLPTSQFRTQADTLLAALQAADDEN